MAISRKGKRKLVFRNITYLWCVKKDEDTLDDYLFIISEDRQTCLYYRLNQIGDYLTNPKIAIAESKTMKKGTYLFFPPLADEVISRHNVCAILKWYHDHKPDIEPIQFVRLKNPLENIDFKTGKVAFLEEDFDHPKEDMLQVVYPNNFILDVGWYGTSKAYIIYIIKNENWEVPFLKTHKSIWGLREAILNAIELIEKENKDFAT